MDLAIKKMIVGSILTIFTVVMTWLIITSMMEYRAQKAIENIAKSTNRIIERQQEQMRIDQKQREQDRIHAKNLEIQRKQQEEWQKAKALKEQSPQCKFWRLQKRDGTSDKADEKIELYCNP